MNSIRNFEINNFFETLYSKFDNYYNNNNFNQIQSDVRLMNNIFSSIKIIPKNCNISLTNYSITGNDYMWKQEYKLIKENLYAISLFFSCNEITYAIFKLIKELFISNNKIIPEYFNNLYNIFIANLETTHNALDTNIFKELSDKFYVGSLNFLIKKMLYYFNSNYNKYIREKNYYDEFYNEFTKISQKNNCCYLLIQNIYCTSENDFNQDNYYKFLISYWNNSPYNLYVELYNYLKSFVTIFEDNELINSKKLDKIKPDKIKTDKIKSNKIKTYNKKTIPKPLKQKVWNKWVGIEIGQTKCLCCKLHDISQGSFSCGHIIAEINGGELKMDNLKPICSSCNSSMGTQNMNDYMIKYGF